MSFLVDLFTSKNEPPPTRDSPEVAEARRRAREAERLRQGRGATILTRGLGTPPAASGPSLLGGAR